MAVEKETEEVRANLATFQALLAFLSGNNPKLKGSSEANLLTPKDFELLKDWAVKGLLRETELLNLLREAYVQRMVEAVKGSPAG